MSALVPSDEQLALFAPALVTWQARHGRHHLPWQRTQDPYHVWLSEIMLQQTQVATVLGYFQRFLQTFPTVQALAQAQQEQVMALWAGLGYYSRARNLHRCAQEVVGRFGGAFPHSVEQLLSLPGIGPSTAAAIASFCFGQQVSIFDGNVKRVLSRLLAFEGDLSAAAPNKLLHAHAQALVMAAQPQVMPRYTQGLMDLGATVCHVKTPQCACCPVLNLCEAYRLGRPTAFPVKTNKLKRTSERWYVLLLETEQAVWLQQRGNTGIWGGLQAPLVFKDLQVMTQWLNTSGMWAGSEADVGRCVGSSIKHQLTHKELLLLPVVLSVVLPVGRCEVPSVAHVPKAVALQEQGAACEPPTVAEQIGETVGEKAIASASRLGAGAWVEKKQLAQAALPAPIKKWLLAEYPAA